MKAGPSIGGDAGSGTVLALGLVAVVIAIGLTAVLLGAGLAGRQRVIAGADAAALAAADGASGAVAGAPCELAAQAAGRHRTEIVACAVSGAEARVLVAAAVLGVRVHAAARAGPPEPPERPPN